ncbi:MAG TPA: carboxypeptidase-like regulatory domain-containing protein [Cyclobacteriaceae bacterium]
MRAGWPEKIFALWVSLLILAGLCLASTARAQVRVSGIVIDSVTFKTLAGVHVRAVGAGGVVTDEQGAFSIVAAPFDTLIFSSVGYIPVRFPVVLDEEDIIIVMSEDVTYLHPVVVTAPLVRSPLIREKVKVEPRVSRPAPLATEHGIAFDYFSRAQREKRKLFRTMEANQRVEAYAKIVADPLFKSEMIRRYDLTENAYYAAIENFNLHLLDSIAYKTPEEVEGILDGYFCRVSYRCR